MIEQIEQERALFEDFARSHTMSIFRSPAAETAYASAITRCAWLAWQAAIAARATASPEQAEIPVPRVGGHENAESAATPSAGTIDTQHFRELVSSAWLSDGSNMAPLITYIMDWHSAGVAAARVEGWQEREAHMIEVTVEQRDAIAAAAREQALEEAASVCGRIAASNIGEEGTAAAMDCLAGIRALASQPATTRQTDEQNGGSNAQ